MISIASFVITSPGHKSGIPGGYGIIASLAIFLSASFIFTYFQLIAIYGIDQ